MNGCVKGKVGEREWRDFLRERGIQAKRGQQHAGGSDSPDVMSELDDLAHWEVKRVENLSIYPAMEQACNDSAATQIPVVAHRRNHKEWLCTVRGSDLVSLLLLAKFAGGPAAIQTAISKQVSSVVPPVASLDWPESRGTTGTQLMQLHQEAENEQTLTPQDVRSPVEDVRTSDEKPAG